jgi:hypothetical protein
MATSTNYGWSEPDNTSLVKDGAQAIRTLGNAIDTTMATKAVAANPVINSAFQVWQRSTSVAVPASSQVYTADRWNLANGANAMVVARQSTNDTTNLPNIQYCAKETQERQVQMEVLLLIHLKQLIQFLLLVKLLLLVFMPEQEQTIRLPQML